MTVLLFGLVWAGGFGALWYYSWRTDRFVRAALSGPPPVPPFGYGGHPTPPPSVGSPPPMGFPPGPPFRQGHPGGPVPPGHRPQ